MADSHPYPDTNDDTGVGPGRGSTTNTPHWVKVLGIIVILHHLLVLRFVILHLTGHQPKHG